MNWELLGRIGCIIMALGISAQIFGMNKQLSRESSIKLKNWGLSGVLVGAVMNLIRIICMKG